MKSRLDIIRELAENEVREAHRPERVSCVYPLLLCLSDDELIELFWEYIYRKSSVASVAGLLAKRIHEDGPGSFGSLIDGIYASLETLKWNDYCRLRKFFASVIESFPKEQIQRYFDYFYEDRRTYDRGKAIQVAHLIWSPEIEEKVWGYFLETGERTCFRLLLERSDLENFAKIFRDLWRNDHFPFAPKVELLRRLAKHRFSVVTFLRKESPLSYLHAVVIAGEGAMSREEALKIVVDSKNERELGFSLWCLGKLGYWNELIELDRKVPELQRRFRHDRLRGLGIPEDELAKYDEAEF